LRKKWKFEISKFCTNVTYDLLFEIHLIRNIILINYRIYLCFSYLYGCTSWNIIISIDSTAWIICIRLQFISGIHIIHGYTHYIKKRYDRWRWINLQWFIRKSSNKRNKYNVLLNSDFNINPNRKKDLFKLRYSNNYMSCNPNHFQIISFIILKFYNLFDLTINFVWF
jgi:hypothetical protein